MMNQNIVLVVDAGNTAVKIGVYQNSELNATHRFDLKNISEIEAFYIGFNNPICVLSSVLSEESTQMLLNIFRNCLKVDHKTPFPIQFNYKTFNTLGIDRICNAVAAAFLCQDKDSVSIDIGTCIKFDFVDKNKVYQGGSISPGIVLRYKALNDYTANLPLLNEKEKINLIGKSTVESIQSGVLNGIQAEINDLIQRYTMEFTDLTFFMTGGDAHYFDFPIKNNIFVDENLTLKGLYQIYLFNAH